jgi:cytochrome c5
LLVFSRAQRVATCLIIIGHVFLLGKQAIASVAYEKSCARCHDSGVLGAPLLKSIDLQQRMEARGPVGLYKSILEGRARMPKRGGCFSCTDIELRQALDYMLKGVGD